MRPERHMVRLGSARTVRNVGLLLGLLIMVGVVAVLLHDRASRIDAARRQSMALATGIDRLMMYEMRNLERALTGIALDGNTYFNTAPAQAPSLFAQAIDGVLSRHPELESITLFDPNGQPRTAGEADPALPAWIRSHPASDRPLFLGPLQDRDDQGWVLPVALRTPGGDWLVARLHTWEFQNMIDRLDTGRDGSVAVLDARGTVLARSLAAHASVGRQVTVPTSVLVSGGGTASMEVVSSLDQVAREAAFSATSGYPVVVGAGISLDQALVSWRIYAVIGIFLVLVYWLGWLVLVRRMVASDVTHEAMLDELQSSADWLRQAQTAAHTGVWRVEADRGRVRASEHMARLFGFPPTADQIPVERFFERMHDEDRARVEAEFALAHAQSTPFRSEYRIILPDGKVRWIIARGATVTDHQGRERMTGTIVDITERRESLARVERAETQFRELFERNPLPFWVVDVDTLRFVAVNEAALSVYGYTRAQFLSMTLLQLHPTDDLDEVRDVFSASATASDTPDGVSRVWVHFTREGSRIDVRIRSSPIDFAGRPARLVLAEDVTERVAYERDLGWRATHDSTTGLLTIGALVEELDALKVADPTVRYSIAYVQLRDLELVAPTLGRRASETILRAAAERFGWLGQSFGFAAYRPAESFVIVALDAGEREALLASLVRATATPVDGDGGTHPLEASIGIADGPSERETAEQVIGNAALAALQARRDNMPIVSFDATMSAQASGRLTLASRLRQALDQREFELFFQPIQRVSDGRLMSLEALLRWRRADGGFVPPLDFIPLCEESGLIVPLGEWVFEEAARCHGLLSDHGHSDLSIAVNVSAVQILSDTLPAALRSLHARHGLPRGAIHVELTESVLLKRPDAARAVMTELRGLGVHISLDDFGTGFSSMGYLRDLPLDYLKVDRAFVANVHRDARNASICRALVALAHGLELKIVAEGVECQEQLDWLRTHRCDLAQGYHLGRPVPLDELLESLGASTGAGNQAVAR